MISLVYAISRNGVIGRDGGLPWSIPSDLQHFRDVTMGKPIIMGRKTWESLPRKPLPGRLNIVLTRHPTFYAEGAIVVQTLEAATQAAQKSGVDEICVIGGADVFKAFWPLAQRIHLTKVSADVAGDTFMPQISPEEWNEHSRSNEVQHERDSHPYVTSTYERRHAAS
jgi:dihydrofolate reductase